MTRKFNNQPARGGKKDNMNNHSSTGHNKNIYKETKKEPNKPHVSKPAFTPPPPSVVAQAKPVS
jgi:hypothetical protein